VLIVCVLAAVAFISRRRCGKRTRAPRLDVTQVAVEVEKPSRPANPGRNLAAAEYAPASQTAGPGGGSGEEFTVGVARASRTSEAGAHTPPKDSRTRGAETPAPGQEPVQEPAAGPSTPPREHAIEHAIDVVPVRASVPPFLANEPPTGVDSPGKARRKEKIAAMGPGAAATAAAYGRPSGLGRSAAQVAPPPADAPTSATVDVEAPPAHSLPNHPSMAAIPLGKVAASTDSLLSPRGPEALEANLSPTPEAGGAASQRESPGQEQSSVLGWMMGGLFGPSPDKGAASLTTSGVARLDESLPPPPAFSDEEDSGGEAKPENEKALRVLGIRESPMDQQARVNASATPRGQCVAESLSEQQGQQATPRTVAARVDRAKAANSAAAAGSSDESVGVKRI
jgi:hypothetical protein